MMREEDKRIIIPLSRRLTGMTPITQDPVEPFGENIEELRHAWVMMAEAFGQPILDYDNIPEPGYDRKADPVGSVVEERLQA